MYPVHKRIKKNNRDLERRHTTLSLDRPLHDSDVHREEHEDENDQCDDPPKEPRLPRIVGTRDTKDVSRYIDEGLVQTHDIENTVRHDQQTPKDQRDRKRHETQERIDQQEKDTEHQYFSPTFTQNHFL